LLGWGDENSFNERGIQYQGRAEVEDIMDRLYIIPSGP